MAKYRGFKRQRRDPDIEVDSDANSTQRFEDTSPCEDSPGQEVRNAQTTRHEPKACQKLHRRIKKLQNRLSVLQDEKIEWEKNLERVKDELKLSKAREKALEVQIESCTLKMQKNAAVAQAGIRSVESTIATVLRGSAIQNDSGATSQPGQPVGISENQSHSYPPSPLSTSECFRQNFTELGDELAVLKLREERKVPWAQMTSAFQELTGRKRSIWTLQNISCSIKRNERLEKSALHQEKTIPADGRMRSPLLWRTPPILFFAMVFELRKQEKSFEDVCNFLDSIGEKSEESSVRSRYQKTQNYYINIDHVTGDEQWLLDTLRGPWLAWLFEKELKLDQIPWLGAAIQLVRESELTEQSEQQQWLESVDEGWWGRWKIWGELNFSEKLPSDWVAQLMSIHCDPNLKQPKGHELRTSMLRLFRWLDLPWPLVVYFFERWTGISRLKDQLRKHLNHDAKSRGCTILEDRDLKELVGCGGVRQKRNASLVNRLCQKYRLGTEQVRYIYEKERGSRSKR